MKWRVLVAASLLVALAASSARSQTTQLSAPAPRQGPQAAARQPARSYNPTAEELSPIKARLEQLNASIADLKATNADDDLVVDAESCAWVVNNIVRVPGGFIDRSYVSRCMTLLNDGMR